MILDPRRIAPPRFLLFALVTAAGIAAGALLFDWRRAVMLGFDAGAIAFLVSTAPLLRHGAPAMRASATRNDANRPMLLALTVGVTLAVLAAIATELSEKGAPQPPVVALIVATLVLAWAFSTVVYALHYAHLFYLSTAAGGDRGGLDVPGTREPDYWDMLYFSATMGMTFQTSDVEITSPAIRRVATGHGLIAFVFNIGVLAFTVNVLGG